MKNAIFDCRVAPANACNNGCLPQTLADAVAQCYRVMGVPFVADSQPSSLVGNVPLQEAVLRRELTSPLSA